jgi:hypothetical protein
MMQLVPLSIVGVTGKRAGAPFQFSIAARCTDCGGHVPVAQFTTRAEAELFSHILGELKSESPGDRAPKITDAPPDQLNA